jgi:hypothetical protein
MGIWLPKLETFGELDVRWLHLAVKAQLLNISVATINRLLKPAKDTTRPKMPVRYAEHEQAPASSKPTRSSAAATTWPGACQDRQRPPACSAAGPRNVAICNGADKWVVKALDEILTRLSFP